MGLSSMALGSARQGLGAPLEETRQCSEPSLSPSGESRASSEEAEGIRKRPAEAWSWVVVCWSLQINFAFAKAPPYLLFVNMPHKLG